MGLIVAAASCNIQHLLFIMMFELSVEVDGKLNAWHIDNEDVKYL